MALLDEVSLEILVPPVGAFIIGRSQVGDALSPSDAELVWEDMTCDIREMDIQRGGSRDGVAVSLDVGTLTAVAVNKWDPMTYPDVKPNTPVRVKTKYALDETIMFSQNDFETATDFSWVDSTSATSTFYFTDPVLNSRVAFFQRLGEGGDNPLGFWLSNPSVIAEVNDTTMSYVDVSFRVSGLNLGPMYATLSGSTGYTELTETIENPTWKRVSGRIPITASGPTPSVWIGGWAVDWTGTRSFRIDDLKIEVSIDRQNSMFTGIIQDISTVRDRDGNVYTTIMAVDGVQSLANTMRYGAVVEGGVEYESWANRIQRLSLSARTPVDAPASDEESRLAYFYQPFRADVFSGNPDGWVRFGTKPANLVARDLYTGGGGALINTTQLPASGATVNQTAYTYGIEREVTGLTIGRKYRFQGSVTRWFNSLSEANVYALGVKEIGWDTPFELADLGARYTIPYFEFIATAETHTLQIALAENINFTYSNAQNVEAVFWHNIALYEFDDSVIPLQDIVYESNLANHFDLASNSSNATWWVDRENVVQFRRQLGKDDLIEAKFSDNHPQPIVNQAYDYSNAFEFYPSKTRVKNTILNSLPTSTTGWQSNGGAPLTFVADDGGEPAIEAVDPDGGQVYADALTAYRPLPTAVGQWIGFGVDVKGMTAATASTMRLRIVGYNGMTVTGGNLVQAITTTGYTRLYVTAQVTNMGSGGFVRALIWPSTSDAGASFRFRKAVTVVEDTESDAISAVATYFNSDTPDTALYKYEKDTDGLDIRRTMFSNDVTVLKTNLARTPIGAAENGQWDVGTFSGWTFVESTISPTPGHGLTGVNTSVKSECTAAQNQSGLTYLRYDQWISIPQGQQYTVTVSFRLSGTRFMQMYYYNGPEYVMGPNISRTGGTWYRVSQTLTSQTNDPFQLAVLFSMAATVGFSIEATGMQIELGDTATEFFSGESGKVSDFEWYGWSGGYNNSVSNLVKYKPGGRYYETLDSSNIDPLHVCYTDIGISYDTRNMVNDIAMNNHGRDAVSGNADDITYSVKDTDSIGLWGSRGASVDTSIYNEGVWAGTVDVIGGRMLELYSTPKISVQSVRYVSTDHPGITASIDMFSRATVESNGVQYDCRVVGVRHELHDEKWLTTLTLTQLYEG